MSIQIVQGVKLVGTNPATGRPKQARGTGRVVRVEPGTFNGPVTVVAWTNGVETHHSDANRGLVENLPQLAPSSALDSLHQLTYCLITTPAKLATALGVTTAAVESWMDGTSRPNEQSRVALQGMVQRARSAVQAGSWGRVALAIQNAQITTAVALQNPAERRTWMAERAAKRAAR